MVEQHKYISDNGHLKDEYVSLYIDALLLDKFDDLPKEVRAHVEGCQDCKHTILEGYDIAKESGIFKGHPYFDKIEKTGLKKTTYFVFVKLAASILFLVSISLIGYYTFFNKPQFSEKYSESIDTIYGFDTTSIKNFIDEDNIITADLIDNEPEEKNQTKSPGSDKLIAEHILEGEEFEVPPIMIAMLGNVTRSGYFKAIEPKDSSIFKSSEPIKIIWESEVEEELILKVFNNKEHLVFESETLESNEYIFENNLLQGSYIWKIESSDELYHLGLFFIIK